MAKKIIHRAALTGMLLGTFTLGYFYGSVSQQNVDAQGLGGFSNRPGNQAARWAV